MIAMLVVDRVPRTRVPRMATWTFVKLVLVPEGLCPGVASSALPERQGVGRILEKDGSVGSISEAAG